MDPLPVVGPSGHDAAPNFSTFLKRPFDEKNGAFPERRDIPSGPLSGGGEPSTAFDRDGLTVKALGILLRGNMPTLA